ncbi:MAG: hypothetical protein ACTHOD_08540 [Motilibacteraceae bacterium]
MTCSSQVRARRAAAALAPLLLLVPALSACSPDHVWEKVHGEPAGEKELRAAQAPAPRDVCAAEARAVARPNAVPADLPLPAGTVVTAADARSGGRTVVTGIAPTPFEDALVQLQQAFPAAGYALAAGEVEQRDAESNWAGHGLRGRWALRASPTCAGEVLVSVLVAPAG